MPICLLSSLTQSRLGDRCSQGGTWAGVGHQNAAGGGPRNSFGVDFAAAGLEWTVELCQTDSDGDGRTNGVELGDPNCTWSPDNDAALLPAQSHPGLVDEPADSSPSYCDDYEDPEDVEILDISFTNPNTLNSTRTRYVCEQMRVDPPDGINQQFQVRTDVLLDNPQVLHHIFIYHCDDSDSSDGNRVGQGSYDCNGVEGTCQIVAGWAVGPESTCEPPNVASYIDFSRSNVFKIEAHYDNALQLNNVQDQSGMSLRLTPTPRNLESGLLILGMSYFDRQFNLPARQLGTTLTNLCPTEGTLHALNHPVWVYSWNPHMHLYGKKLVTEHYRCGEKIGEIGRIEHYEFDNQQTYVLNPPVKILPGDALLTTCTYETTSVETDVAGGEETTEEMCDNYLGYYPWAGTTREPSLFTACQTYEEGLNPRYVGFDDSTPFMTLDLAGDIYLEQGWNPDPLKNVAPCCATDECESDFLASPDEPCGVTADCASGLSCEAGLCVVEVSPVDETPDEDTSAPAEDASAGDSSGAILHQVGKAAFFGLLVTLFGF